MLMMLSQALASEISLTCCTIGTQEATSFLPHCLDFLLFNFQDGRRRERRESNTFCMQIIYLIKKNSVNLSVSKISNINPILK